MCTHARARSGPGAAAAAAAAAGAAAAVPSADPPAGEDTTGSPGIMPGEARAAPLCCAVEPGLLWPPTPRPMKECALQTTHRAVSRTRRRRGTTGDTDFAPRKLCATQRPPSLPPLWPFGSESPTPGAPPLRCGARGGGAGKRSSWARGGPLRANIHRPFPPPTTARSPLHAPIVRTSCLLSSWATTPGV